MAQLTQKAIVQSFAKLLSERPFEKITVRDIVDDCGITRNTFYYHFEDVYAVLDAILRGETQKLLSLREQTGKWEACWAELIDFVMRNKKMLNHIYNSSRRDELLRGMEEATRLVIETYVEDLSADTGASAADKKLLAGFYRLAMSGLLMEWIREGMRGDVEASLRRLNMLLDGCLAMALRKSGENPAES